MIVGQTREGRPPGDRPTPRSDPDREVWEIAPHVELSPSDGRPAHGPIAEYDCERTQFIQKWMAAIRAEGADLCATLRSLIRPAPFCSSID